MEDTVSKLVSVVSPNGKAGTMPYHLLEEALKSGYRIESDEEKLRRINEEKYSDSPIQSSLAGVARGLTFGASDVLLPETGLVERSTLRGLKEFNPGASTLGEIGGAIAPILLSGGTGATAEIAGLAPTSLLAKAGTGIAGAAEKAVSSGLAKTALGEVSKSFLTKAAALGAAGALEGSVYGAGQALSEEALGDPDFTAESLLATKGLSNLLKGAGKGALIGGVTGVGVAGVESALSSAVSGIQSGIRGLKKIPEAKLKSLQTQANSLREELISQGATPEDLNTLDDFLSKPLGSPEGAEYRQQLLKADSPIIREKYVKDFSKELTKSHVDFEDQIKSFYDKVVPAERKALLKKTLDVESARANAHDILQDAWKTVEEMRSRPDLYAQSYPSKIEQILDPLTKDLQNPKMKWKALKLFERVEDAKRSIDGILPYGSNMADMALSEREAVNLTKGIANGFRSFLEDENSWGAAGARQSRINNAYSDLKELTGKKGLFRTYFMKDIGGEYEIDPGKIDTFLKGADKGRYEFRQRAFDEYIKARNAMTDAMQESYQNAKANPSLLREFSNSAGKSTEAMSGLIDKSIKANQLSRLRWYEMQNQIVEMGDLFKKAMSLPFNAMIDKFGGRAGRVISDQVGEKASGKTILARLEKISELEKKWTGIDKFADKISSFKILENAKKETEKKISSSVSSFLDNAETKFSAPLSVSIAEKTGLTKTAASDYDRHLDELIALGNNPEAMDAKITSSLGALSEHAPNTATSLAVKAGALGALAYQSMPKNPMQGLEFTGDAGRWHPNDTQDSSWKRTRQYIERPDTILGDMEKNSITPEAISVLENFPAIKERIKQEFITQIADRKNDIPYEKRLLLSKLFGVPMDYSMTPKMFNRLQKPMQSHQVNKGVPLNVDLKKYSTNIGRAEGR